MRRLNLGAECMFFAFLLLALEASLARAEGVRVAREGAYDQWLGAEMVVAGADTLVIVKSESAPPETLAVRAFGVVEVERGRHPRAVNILRGFATGVVLGVVIGGISYRVRYGDCDGDLCGLGALCYIGAGAGVGSTVGAMAGGIPVQIWQRIYVSPAAKQWLHAHRTWP